MLGVKPTVKSVASRAKAFSILALPHWLAGWAGSFISRRLPKAVIWEAGCLQGPWQQEEGHVEVRNQVLLDCGTIFGAHSESFLGTKA